MKAALLYSSYLTVSPPNLTLPYHHPPPLRLSPSVSLRQRMLPYARATFRAKAALSPTPSLTEEEDGADTVSNEKFDWYSQWYAVMPVCDLDRRRPHAKRVMGLDVVVWWDRNEATWKVFEDSCPHRLAPFSEGRIDREGRLQCVYHGWCFDGSGDCKLIPQAPVDGPPVHTSRRACAAAYPTTIQHDIVWFWPNTDPEYKDVILKQNPPYIPELDDPSFTKTIANRDIPYGYEVLIENLMDPAHIPYAHLGILRVRQPKDRNDRFTAKVDREGGRPLDMRITKLDIGGFLGDHGRGSNEFISPCVFHADFSILDPAIGSDSSDGNQNVPAATARDEKRAALVFICIPVSPGRSRLIWAFTRNFGACINRMVPRWMFHVGQNNLVLDSDLCFLHIQERNIIEAGSSNWQKACYVPTKSDALVIGFRRWLNEYAGSQVDWRGKYSCGLPPTPSREQLMDRYWSHVVNCRSCSTAYKGLNALEFSLQVLSVASIGILAVMKQNTTSALVRSSLIATAVLFFGGSKWLAHFTYKSFRYHGYDHSFR